MRIKAVFPFLLVLLLAVGAVLLTPGAAAQDDAFNLDEPAATASAGDIARGRSFGSAFFISRKMVPGSEETEIELLGSLIIWFLLFLSMASIGLIGLMALTNQRKSIVPEGVVAEMRRRLESGDFRGVIETTKAEHSFFSQVLGAALREANHGYGAMIRSLEQTADELTTNRLRRIEFLNVLGQVSPMIGLFGTVYGMILAFQSIVLAGGNADPVLLAGGIGTALTTTFWGLVVAIPALTGYAVVRNRIDALTAEATLVAEEMINQFRPAKKAATATKKTSTKGASE